MRRAAVVAAAAVAVVFGGTSSASADIKALDGDSGALVTHWDSAKCKLKKGVFTSSSQSNDKWFLDINIPHFPGFGAGPIPLVYGQKEPNFFASGSGGVFSNVYALPGVEGQPGGDVNFSPNGKRMAIGFSPASNDDMSAALSIAGSVKCTYPRKRHH